MPLSITSATFDDAGTIAALQTRVAEDLTRRHGVGHWSAPVTEQNVARLLIIKLQTFMAGEEIHAVNIRGH